MLTALEIIQRTEAFFKEKGVANARLDAELIIGQVLGLKRLELYLQFDRPLTEAELTAMRPLVKRRGAREPLQYVIGSAAFCDLTLKVDPRVLIPRPETEELFELACSSVSGSPRQILDMGTGSGALALALARQYPEARVTALDVDADSLALARENAEANELSARVEFLQSDWYSALPEGVQFDLIVSNPPYLTEAEMGTAAPEVVDHEPPRALVAGADGLDCLRVILQGLGERLSSGAVAVFETGIAQHDALNTLCVDLGLTGKGLNDLSGRPRFYRVRASS